MMNPEKPNRRSVRLKDYDYSWAGAYFVTVCTHNKNCIFGEVADGIVQLSDTGKIARDVWYEIPRYFDQVELDEFILMPNHLHGIIVIHEGDREGRTDLINQVPTTKPTTDNLSQWILMQNPKHTLSKIVRLYKAKTTKIIHDKGFSHTIWQPRFYEHIIQNEKSLEQIREYIVNNPIKWEMDEENPTNIA